MASTTHISVSNLHIKTTQVVSNQYEISHKFGITVFKTLNKIKLWNKTVYNKLIDFVDF